MDGELPHPCIDTFCFFLAIYTVGRLRCAAVGMAAGPVEGAGRRCPMIGRRGAAGIRPRPHLPNKLPSKSILAGRPIPTYLPQFGSGGWANAVMQTITARWVDVQLIYSSGLLDPADLSGSQTVVRPYHRNPTRATLSEPSTYSEGQWRRSRALLFQRARRAPFEQ